MLLPPDPEDSPPAESATPPLVPATVIARAWGCSRAYVYKCIGRGCPQTSVEAATEWRSAHAVHGVGSRGANPPSPAPSGAAPANETSGRDDIPDSGNRVGKRVRLGTIEASLKRAITNEEMCAQEVDASRGYPAKLLVSINAYNRAQANRMETEKTLLKLQQERRELIHIDAALEMMSRAWLPLLARLRSSPKRVAMKANPSDDVLAEAVFAAEIEEAIAEGQASYEEAIG